MSGPTLQPPVDSSTPTLAPQAVTPASPRAPRGPDAAFDLQELPPAPGEHASFVRWLAGSLVLALVLIGGVNWYVDPTGVTGRATKWRIAENAEVRSEKLDLYGALAQPPQVTLLGSSRTMKFDPAVVEQLTGQRTFNAAVSGGVPRDALLFVRHLEREQADEFPHLVWGLDADAFRDKRLRDGLSTDPRMRRYVPRSERIVGTAATAGALLDWQTMKATGRSLLTGGVADAAGHGRRDPFTRTGFQRWSLAFPKTAGQLEDAVERQIEQYAGFVFERDAYTRIEAEPLAEFEQVVRIANRHGDTPTIFLTPYHPTARDLLERHDIAAREREVRERLTQLQEDGRLRFRFIDLSELDSFGGDPAQFYDGIHMTPQNTRRVLERLHSEGLLERPRDDA